MALMVATMIAVALAVLSLLALFNPPITALNNFRQRMIGLMTLIIACASFTGFNATYFSLRGSWSFAAVVLVLCGACAVFFLGSLLLYFACRAEESVGRIYR